MTPIRSGETTISTPQTARDSGLCFAASTDTKGGAGLDFSRLENVKTKTHGNKTTAACPACREAGNDTSGDHLWIGPDGRFGCLMFPGASGADHRRRIFDLAGIPSESPRPLPPAKPQKSKPPHTWPDPETAAKSCTPRGFALAAVYRYDRDRRFRASARPARGRRHRGFSRTPRRDGTRRFESRN
jgi:hypothetical protein